MSAPVAKPWITSIHAYVPGKSAGKDGRALVKLSANENPLGTSPAALAAVNEAQTAAALYPDPDSKALRDAIGKAHGLDPARIVCGTGSGELLHGAVQGFAGQGDEVLFARYSFSLYPLLAHKVGAEAVLVDDDDYTPSIDNLLAAVTERTRVVLLDNPNNPVGTWLPREEVARLHAGLPSDVLLVIDQAYAEFLANGEDDGGLDLAAAHENVLVTRTFSKAYGLAGERVGWATGAPHLIDVLNRLRGAFNVTATGQRAAIAALGDRDFVEASREHNRVWRDWLASEIGQLSNHGLRAIPSGANFILVLFEGDLGAETAYEALMEAGYIVRWLPGQGLPNALRITIGHGDDMRAMVAVIRTALGEPVL